MRERKASEAVIYLMGRDQMARFQPFKPSDKKAAVELFSAEFPIDDLKYLAMVLIVGSEGNRVFSEFYPIAPAMEWPDHVSREIIERAVAVAGYGSTTVEGELISVDARGKH